MLDGPAAYAVPWCLRTARSPLASSRRCNPRRFEGLDEAEAVRWLLLAGAEVGQDSQHAAVSGVGGPDAELVHDRGDVFLDCRRGPRARRRGAAPLARRPEAAARPATGRWRSRSPRGRRIAPDEPRSPPPAGRHGSPAQARPTGSPRRPAARPRSPPPPPAARALGRDRSGRQSYPPARGVRTGAPTAARPVSTL